MAAYEEFYIHSHCGFFARMSPRTSLSLSFLAAGLSAVLAANDWTRPCFDGECSYEMPGQTETSSVLKLHASPSALSDITPAAGWVILDCDPHVLEQDVRLVCEGDISDSKCSHVFSDNGPEDKIIRLPESCGSGPFARVVKATVAEDQSVPSHFESKIAKRDGTAPQVYTFAIDTNFAAADPTKHGKVQFAFIGATVPGIDLNVAFTDSIWDDVTGWVSKTVHKAGEVIADGSKWIVEHLPNHFEVKPTIQATNISISTAPLNWSVPIDMNECPIGKVGLTLESGGWIEARAGVLIAGDILPPSIHELGIFGGVNGEINAKLGIELLIQGGFTVEKNLINDIGMPGFSIPGVITVGPFLSVSGRIQGHVEVNVNVGTELNYVIKDMRLYYPSESANDHAGDSGLETKESKLSMSAFAEADARGFLQGTVTPKINIGVSVGGGAATATIFVGADAWIRGSVQALASASTGSVSRREGYTPPYARNWKRQTAGFGGCFWLDTGVHLFGGGKGKILDWEADKEFNIWDSPTWNLYTKCWIRGEDAGTLGISNPELTIEQVNNMSKAPKGCPAGLQLSKSMEDVVPGKKFVNFNLDVDPRFSS
ncbi:hypothetical protein ONZ45_g5373 [Pleurotus djamor]|nr:hypothetical protein ONZ45_g5373 [Pleurotus djamor]